MEFAFAIYYLSGRSYATDFRERSRPEWPPHPSRFFSAMVAALHESGLGEDSRTALMWLENLGAPRISASKAWERGSVTTYVPTNEEAHDSVPSLRNLSKQGRSFPSVTLENPVVHFIWSLKNEKEQEEFHCHEEALRDIASRVTYLGHSASLVSVSLSTSPPAATYEPDEGGDIALRVATRGRLEELELSYHLGQRPTIGLFKLYRSISEQQVIEAVTEGVFKDLIIFRLDGSLPIKSAVLLSEAVRGKVARLIGSQADTIIYGRGHHPHCAFVALPHVGFEHADGHLLGFAVLLHRDLSDEERRAVFRALAKLYQESRLKVGAAGEFKIDLVEANTQTVGLREVTWRRPSRAWTSVTPVLFDRYPKGKKLGASAGDIIAGSCRHIGLPLPETVYVGKYSSLIGVPPADARSLSLGEDDKTTRYVAHVTIIFEEKVGGPIVLGAGRHYGLGLMRPISIPEDKGSET